LFVVSEYYRLIEMFLKCDRQKLFVCYPLIVLVWAIVLVNPLGFLYEDDEGAYLYLSASVSDGQSIYSDVLAAKPPLLFYIGALIYRVFGSNLLAFRYFASLLGLIASILIFKLFSKKNEPLVGLALSVAFILDPLVFTQMRFFRTDILMLTTFFAGLYFISQQRGWREIIFSGLFFSLSVLSRDDAFVYSSLLLLYFIYKYNDRKYWVIIAVIIGTFAISLFTRGEHQFIGSVSQQLNISEIGHSSRIEKYINFLWYLIRTYPVWWIFPLIVLPIIRINRENFSIFSILIIATNIIMMFLSNSIFIRYTIITVLVRLFLLSDLMNVIKSKLKYPIIIISIALQIAINPPPILELVYRDSSIISVVNHLKGISNKNDVLLADYGYFNFLSGVKGTSISGYLSGGSVNSGEINAANLISVIEHENVEYILIHSEGRVYYPYGCEIYYYEPHHIKGVKDYIRFEEYIETKFSLVSTFYGSGPVFKLYKKTAH